MLIVTSTVDFSLRRSAHAQHAMAQATLEEILS